MMRLRVIVMNVQGFENINNEVLYKRIGRKRK